jgi:hypothetical protein
MRFVMMPKGAPLFAPAVWVRCPGTLYNPSDQAGQMSRSRQKIRYLRTSDGVKLAWAEAG